MNNRAAIRQQVDAEKAQARKVAILNPAPARKPAPVGGSSLSATSSRQGKMILGLQAKIAELEETHDRQMRENATLAIQNADLRRENEQLRQINRQISTGEEALSRTKGFRNDFMDWGWLLEFEIGSKHLIESTHGLSERNRVYSSLWRYGKKYGIHCEFKEVPEGYLITRTA